MNSKQTFRDWIPKQQEHATDYVADLVQQIQKCSWNTFRFSEIVILEKCLNEIVPEDPRINLFIKKLASDCVFIEPERKINHLNRDAASKRRDSELKKQGLQLRQRVQTMNEHLEEMTETFGKLSQEQVLAEGKIKELERLTSGLREQCEILLERFNFTLERTLYSFESSLNVIKFKIPGFIKAVGECGLIGNNNTNNGHNNTQNNFHCNSAGLPSSSISSSIISSHHHQQHEELQQQSSSRNYHDEGELAANPLREGYEELLMDLVRGKWLTREQKCLISVNAKERCISLLGVYLSQLGQLFADLSLIDEVCRFHCDKEMRYLKALEDELINLEKPLLGEAPKRTRTVRITCDNQSNQKHTHSLMNSLGANNSKPDDDQSAQMKGSSSAGKAGDGRHHDDDRELGQEFICSLQEAECAISQEFEAKFRLLSDKLSKITVD